jgi:hypothetical protein
MKNAQSTNEHSKDIKIRIILAKNLLYSTIFIEHGFY